MRTVPVLGWVKAAIDEWLVVAEVVEGRIFRCVARSGTVWGSRHQRKSRLVGCASVLTEGCYRETCAA